MGRSPYWKEKDWQEAIHRLVHEYPSHDYIIDYRELQDIGFQVELFKEDEREAVRGLLKSLSDGRTFIKFVVPDSSKANKEM